MHDQKMQEMSQRLSEGKKEKNTDKLAVETVRGANGAPWKALEDDGEKIHTCEECGEYFRRERDRASRPKKKGKQEHKASGSWNRQPKKTWSK